MWQNEKCICFGIGHLKWKRQIYLEHWPFSYVYHHAYEIYDILWNEFRLWCMQRIRLIQTAQWSIMHSMHRTATPCNATFMHSRYFDQNYKLKADICCCASRKTMPNRISILICKNMFHTDLFCILQMINLIYVNYVVCMFCCICLASRWEIATISPVLFLACNGYPIQFTHTHSWKHSLHMSSTSVPNQN